MKTSVKIELAKHLLDCISDGVINDGNYNNWHHEAFNRDYYIIGYYQCSEWLKRHEIDTFEAVTICQNYEIEHFGGLSKEYNNSEVTVNMLVYIFGEKLEQELSAENVEELEEELNEIINS
jgi:hypothetical protein